MPYIWTPTAANTEVPTSRGDEWVRTPDTVPAPETGANGYLEDGNGGRVYLWVDGVDATFAMSGSTAQSKLRREFYAHNFTQPTISISTQMPNSYQYNRLGAFLRASQRDSMVKQGEVLKLRIVAGGTRTENEDRPGMKGVHNEVFVDGYVVNAPRGAERFINAPPYAFDFVITRAIRFLGLDDESVNAAQLATIMKIVNDPKLDWSWENGKPPKGGKGSNPKGNDLPPPQGNPEGPEGPDNSGGLTGPGY